MFDRLKAVFKTQTQTKTPPETMQSEIAWYHDSDMYRLLGGIDRYNPDELVQRKGNQIYRKMLRDPQVKAAYDLRVNIIVSRGWRFAVDGDDQQEMADLFEQMITNHFVGTWIQAMRSILLCKAHGFSITEKIFEAVEINGKTRWVVRALKPKPYHTFEFDTDNFGNIKQIVQNVDGSDKVIKQEKVVLMVNHPELDPIWGESDLRSVYRPYWEKDVTLKFKNIYIERLAGGFIVATPGADAPSLSAGEKANFEKVLGRINQMTALRAPQGYTIDVKHGPGTTAFEDSVAFNDAQILKGLLIPNLMGFSEQKYGSRALGETQLDAFMMTVQEEGEYLADILNEQVFAQVAWWNFGRKDFPRFMLDGYTNTQKRHIAETWIAAVKDGVVVNTLKDELRTRDLLLYPKVSEGERDELVDELEELQKPPEPKEIPSDMPMDKPEDEPKAPDKQAPETKTTVATIDKLKEIFPNREFKTLAEIKPEVEIAHEGDFLHRADFADIKNKFDTNEAQFVKEMGEPVDQMLSELEDQLKTAKSKDAELTLSSKVKSDFKKVVKNNMRKNYVMGRKEAEKMLQKSLSNDMQLRDRLSFKIRFASAWNVCCSDPNWTVLNFVDGVLLESAEKFFEGYAFQTTADITSTMLEATREVLATGIDEEQGIEEMIRGLRTAIPTIIGTRSADGEITPKAHKARLETIARTSITNIFAQAQVALYNDPALGDFVQGMQYSAVMDKRTTPTCKSLDKRKFLMSDEIWKNIVPPNHHNCRSMLIPITLTDGEVKYSEKKE